MSQFKKSNQKLEKMRGLFFQIGLITACGLTFVAFEWTTSRSIPDFSYQKVIIEEPDWDMPVIIPEEEVVEKPKVKTEDFAKQPDPNKFKKVDDNTKIEDKKEKDVKNKELKFDPKWTDVDDDDDVTDEPFTVVEKMPKFDGNLNVYLGKNLKFTRDAMRLGEGGTVYVEFLVNKKGEVKDVKILRGVNKYLDAEAVRVVKNMPNWSPGMQRGKAVNVLYMLPIKFQLK